MVRLSVAKGTRRQLNMLKVQLDLKSCDDTILFLIKRYKGKDYFDWRSFVGMNKDE